MTLRFLGVKGFVRGGPAQEGEDTERMRISNAIGLRALARVGDSQPADFVAITDWKLELSADVV